MYFQYGTEEMNYLKKKDVKLGNIIEQLGFIERTVDSDLFSAVIHHIVGQQISTKAQETIWKRILENLGEISTKTILQTEPEKLQSFGISFRKVEYILDFARQVEDGTFDLDEIWKMKDEEAIQALTKLRGIGTWTAEMLLLFCMQRQDILSYDDLAIQRGLRMVYHHRKITHKLFEKYKRRYHPYGSIASFYLWAVANGAIPDMKDYAPQKK